MLSIRQIWLVNMVDCVHFSKICSNCFKYLFSHRTVLQEFYFQR